MENNLLVENNGVLEIETETLKELNRLRAEKKEIDEKYKTLTNALNNALKIATNGKGTRVSDYNFVVKGGNWTFELDVDYLKANFPQIYDECLKPVQTRTTYSLVFAKKEKK